MNSHLVAVEVSVECCADQRMQLNGFAFNQKRFERLNTETVQRRRTVQHHRMFVNDFFKDVPNDRILILNHLLGSLDCRSQTAQFKLVEDKRFEELKSHEFRQTALMQFQVRTDGNNGTAGVVNTFTQQVLTEAAALTFDHVCQRLQRTLGRTGHGFAAAAVVQQRVNGFLQHTLFVADDDVRSFKLKKSFQTVVTVDHAAIEVVQIACGETAAVERNQRTKIRRKNRKNIHNHPLRLNAGALEAFENFQTLGNLLDLSFAGSFGKLSAEILDFFVNVDSSQKLFNGFSTHHGLEFVTVFFGLGHVVVFGHELASAQLGHAGINNDIGFEIQDAFDITQRDIENHTHAGRKALQEPNVRNRAGQFNVAHAFAADFGKCDFNAALLADDTLMFQALVFAAKTFVVLNRSENLCAEQAVAFGFERTVVNCLRLLYFTVRPRTNLFRGSNADLDRVKRLILFICLKERVKSFHHFLEDSLSRSKSMSMPRERISLTRTLKDSGIPASIT